MNASVGAATSVRGVVLGFLLPLVLSFVVYAGFSTNYTSNVFSTEGIEAQYDHGIYKYRVLGRRMLLATYRLTVDYNLPTIAPASLKVLDPSGDPRLYTAYFYMNALFLCLTSSALFLMLGGARQTDFFGIDLPIVLITSLIALTEFVVVPYDTPSYFLITLAAWLVIARQETWLSSIALSGIVVLATMIRESAALILSLYFAVHHERILHGWRSLRLDTRETRELAALTACFLGAYVGLRCVYGFSDAAYQEWRLLDNLRPHPLLGLIFFAGMSALFLVSGTRTRRLSVLYAASLPYMLSIQLVANPWEIRLWMPVLLLLLILKISEARGALGFANGGQGRN